ncbi:MAG: glycine cleavage system aminomethyltransferase GcvT [Gaiellaceae bacterium]|jgi:aminomethyltransferase
MAELKRTPFYERHLARGARMVPFAGYELPLLYESVISEHKAVRSDSGVFDVSHMGVLEIEGAAAHESLQRLLSNDLDRIGSGEAQYELMTNEQGGIVDDLIAYCRGESSYLLVVNAANRETDVAWLRERLLEGVELRDVSEQRAVIAVQGPRALERLGLEPAPSFSFAEIELFGVPCACARTGYTGESGCELICGAENAVKLWDAVLAAGVVPCGLGARDTLRLEACLPLHGQDITPETDPIAAGLGWACALEKEFTGVERLREIAAEGAPMRLTAFKMDDPGIPRQGMPIVPDGRVTSGTHSPMLDKGIGMGYVPARRTEPGSMLTIDIRGRPLWAKVVAKPIYTSSKQGTDRQGEW